MKAIILDCNGQKYKEQEIVEPIPYLRIQQPNSNVMVSWKGKTFPATIIGGTFHSNIIETKLIQVEQGIAVYELLEEV